jgi:hypothetical protein
VQPVDTDFQEPGLLEWPEIAEDNERPPPPPLPPLPPPTVAKDRPKPRAAYKGHADLPSTVDKVPDMSTWPQHAVEAGEFLFYKPASESSGSVTRESRGWGKEWVECIGAYFALMEKAGFPVSIA